MHKMKLFNRTMAFHSSTKPRKYGSASAVTAVASKLITGMLFSANIAIASYGRGLTDGEIIANFNDRSTDPAHYQKVRKALANEAQKYAKDPQMHPVHIRQAEKILRDFEANWKEFLVPSKPTGSGPVGTRSSTTQSRASGHARPEHRPRRKPRQHRVRCPRCFNGIQVDPTKASDLYKQTHRILESMMEREDAKRIASTIISSTIEEAVRRTQNRNFVPEAMLKNLENMINKAVGDKMQEEHEAFSLMNEVMAKMRGKSQGRNLPEEELQARAGDFVSRMTQMIRGSNPNIKMPELKKQIVAAAGKL